MKVLVTVGSKYGSTREVGQVVVRTLEDEGFDVTFEDACDVGGVTFYDAVVIGSAVYGGLWRRDASGLIKENMTTLQQRAVWMFSVGMETVVKPGQALDEADGLAVDVGARDHARFPGAIDVSKLNFGEKALIKALNPPLGDFRDMAAVREWSQGIAVELREYALQ
jgi:menaquinone-dependent protoporphyrinogen oxidase